MEVTISVKKREAGGYAIEGVGGSVNVSFIIDTGDPKLDVDLLKVAMGSVKFG